MHTCDNIGGTSCRQQISRCVQKMYIFAAMEDMEWQIKGAVLGSEMASSQKFEIDISQKWECTYNCRYIHN